MSIFIAYSGAARNFLLNNKSILCDTAKSTGSSISTRKPDENTTVFRFGGTEMSARHGKLFLTLQMEVKFGGQQFKKNKMKSYILRWLNEIKSQEVVNT
jgi:hypothetical protein